MAAEQFDTERADQLFERLKKAVHGEQLSVALASASDLLAMLICVSCDRKDETERWSNVLKMLVDAHWPDTRLARAVIKKCTAIGPGGHA